MSTESGHYGLGSGIVKMLTENSVTVQLDEQLSGPPIPVKDRKTNQEFYGIVEVDTVSNGVKLLERLSLV